MSSCNRDGTAHKACSIFYLVLWKKEKLADSCSKKTESHRAQGWKDNASQAGKKSKGVTWEEGSTEGLLRGRGRGGRCAEGDEGWHRERFWPARPPEREVRPQKAAHPIL